jgi:Protein of unknown function (DUF4231)
MSLRRRRPAPSTALPDADPASVAQAEAIRLFNWYARNLKRSRYRFQISELILLAASAAVPVAGILTPGDARPAAIIGAGVVVLTGLRSVFHFYDNWTRFGWACSVIRTELRLYAAAVAPYDDPETRDGILLRKINSTELTETSQWMTLPGPGAPQSPGSPGPAAAGA